ncbi:MAG: ABC transporter permease subunit [Proteobacteria bacterium]|nr:ABC transporter permease subunit [Pseudomonadota bacterium]
MVILALLAASLPAFLRADVIEAHDLSRALTPGFDAFGRACIPLALAALARSLLATLPSACLYLGVSLAMAVLMARGRDPFRFALGSLLDFATAMPGFLLALALGVLFPGSAFTFHLGAFLIAVPAVTRFFESQLLKLGSEDFILAAEALGAGGWHLSIRHYLPALFDSARVVFPSLAVRLILIETSLSFLGLSATPGHETWGRLLAQGKDYLLEAPWILWSAAIPLCLLVGSFHLLADEERL